ncbi:RdgB/HAM1 family non-canonical purine NTP pyrophosphatase [Rhodovarius crocodyli]|uniref:dITP/XTP pyrophosphatase n=1 Tax=Rhodovarius crocodyli TaxID=1979269 RepID=A0A437M3I6_9PROT|nr:RdgB/HAM1 family non-canonical purine NTP pyrophosphatase [Rhodovarius crocodyli]RVT92267.1 RdgB/HAM1 family non-canonical purine NTP pyrophosphatase [Rhodovarius crocodyli]
MAETRRLAPGRLVLASHNAGKLRELSALLAPHGIEVVSAAELDLPEPEETGTTFEENSAIKALAAAEATGLPALADDSGVMIAALGGAPGVYTADWAITPAGRDYAAAMARVAEEAEGSDDRRAAFVSVLALAWPDGHVQHYHGRSDGNWVYPPRGTGGFGYDPIFVPEGDTRTYGEMTPEEKARTNHRARAFARFAQEALKE